MSADRSHRFGCSFNHLGSSISVLLVSTVQDSDTCVARLSLQQNHEPTAL